MLGLPLETCIPLLSYVRIRAIFDCGTRRRQLVRASPSFRGAEWFDSVLYTAGEDASVVFVGEVQALLRLPTGDVAVLFEMDPAAPERGCPLTAGRCTRLKWLQRPGEAVCAVRVVRVSAIRRLVHILPDFDDLSSRCGYDAVPAVSGSSLAARLSMRYYLNTFYPWA